MFSGDALVFMLCLFLQGSGWKVVASFEGNFPNRIKQLPLDRHFDINNVKRVYFSFSLYMEFFVLFAQNLYCIFHVMMVLFTITDCIRGRWLSTLSHISRERAKISDKNCPRNGKGARTTLC